MRASALGRDDSIGRHDMRERAAQKHWASFFPKLGSVAQRTYGVDPPSGRLDYDRLAGQARRFLPLMAQKATRLASAGMRLDVGELGPEEGPGAVAAGADLRR